MGSLRRCTSLSLGEFHAYHVVGSPHRTTSCLTSSHHTSPYLIIPRRVSLHLTTLHLASSHATIPSLQLTMCHLPSRYILEEFKGADAQMSFILNAISVAAKVCVQHGDNLYVRVCVSCQLAVWVGVGRCVLAQVGEWCGGCKWWYEHSNLITSAFLLCRSLRMRFNTMASSQRVVWQVR